MITRNKHSNGHWNEEIEFSCGHITEFSPNYMAASVKRWCTHTASYKATAEKRKAFLAGLTAFVTKYPAVDAKFKENVLKQMGYISSEH